MQSQITGFIPTLSFESFFYLKNGTSAPYFFAIFAIFFESVVTTIRLNNFDFLASATVISVRDLFLIFFKFLFLNAVDFFFAGMKHSTDFFIDINY